MEYNAELIRIGQAVATYTNGNWELGWIVNLKQQGLKWVEYLTLPKVHGLGFMPLERHLSLVHPLP